MLKTFLNIARIWGNWGDKLIKWFKEEKNPVYKLIKIIIILAGLYLTGNTLGLANGLVFIYFPKIYTFLIFTCLTAPPILILLSLIISKIKIEVLIFAFIISVLLCLFEVGAGIFNVWSLPKNLRTIIFPNDAQFPLRGIDEIPIAVDNDGNIYSAITHYSRIQKYNKNGEFIKGWFVDTSGVFNIWVGDDRLHAILSRTHKHVVFDLNGKMIENINITDFNEESSLWEKAGKSVKKDLDGNIYLVENSDNILKITPAGEKSVIIKNPFYLYLIKEPLPAFFLFIIGALMSFISGAIIKFKLNAPPFKFVYFPGTADK